MIIGGLLVFVGAELVIGLHGCPRRDLFLLGRLCASTVGSVGACVVGGLLTEIEVFYTQVVDHVSDLGRVSLAFVRNSSIIEFPSWGLKTTISLRNEVGSTVGIDFLRALILTVSCAAHRVESQLVVGVVEVGRRTDREVSSRQLESLLIPH